MLLSIVFELTTQRTGLLPAHLGRANQAELMAWLARVDPSLAAELHESSRMRPLTCSSLMNGTRRGDQVLVEPARTYWVRFTCLSPETAERVDRGLQTALPTQWTLQGHLFQVIGIYCDAERNGWSGMTTYEDLAARHLLGQQTPSHKVTLDFASPTAFKSNNMHVPVPMPGLVFGSLFDRWNAFSPVQLPDDMRRYGEEAVAVSYYELQTEQVKNKRGATLIGARGTVTYTAMGGDRYWIAAMNLLADFALYSGVGIKTTAGMGQVRRR